MGGQSSFWLSEALAVLSSKVYVDAVDKLHGLYTVLILLFLSALITASHVFGWPIHCWLPAEFQDKAGWREYVETFCFIHNTYYVPIHRDVPTNLRVEVTYYQWVPLALLVQALFFFLPGALWEAALGHYGIDLQMCRHKILSSKEVVPYYRRRELDTLASYLVQIMKDAKASRPYFLTVSYIAVKLVLLANLGCQLVLVYLFLGRTAVELIMERNLQFLVTPGTSDWRQTGLFPRVAFCDFSIKDGLSPLNERKYTVQCTLAANIINEKIFAFLWFWFTGLAAVSLGSLGYWLYVSLLPGATKAFLRRYNRTELAPFSRLLDDHVLAEVGQDGILVLRFLADSTSEIVTTELVLHCLRLLYITPKCPEAIIVLCIQSVLGVLMQGLLVALMLSKLLRPKKRQRHMVFTKSAVICRHNGQLTFQFRVADIAATHIVEPHIRLYCIRRTMSDEGVDCPLDMIDMAVGFDNGTDRILLMWPYTVVHVIDSKSPLYDITEDSLPHEEFEIMAVVEGIVEATGMTCQARTSYLPSEVLWGHRFPQLTYPNPSANRVQIHYSEFEKTLPPRKPSLGLSRLSSATHLASTAASPDWRIGRQESFYNGAYEETGDGSLDLVVAKM